MVFASSETKLLILGTKVRNILVSLLEYKISVLIPFIKGIILRIDNWYFKKRSIKIVEKVGQRLEKKIMKKRLIIFDIKKRVYLVQSS